MLTALLNPLQTVEDDDQVVTPFIWGRQPEIAMPLTGSVSNAAALGTLAPPRLPLAQAIRNAATSFHNLVEAWPDEVYDQGLVQGRMLGRPITFVTDPELIQSLLVDQAHKLVREEAMTRSLQPAIGRGLLIADAHEWRTQRRTAAPAFRPDRIRDLVPAMAAAADATRRRWLAGGERQCLDLQTEMMQTAFDVIIATVISDEEGFDVAGFGQALDTYLGQTNWKMAFALMGVPAWVPHPRSVAGAKAARQLRAMAGHVIRNRRARGVDRPDLLGLLLTARDPETGEGMSEERLVDNLLTFVVAGHETTALAMAWTLRLLSDHPAVERRVLDEIALSSAAGQHPADLERLLYTKQVIFEAMRLYPPAALLVRRAAEQVSLGPVSVPPGGSIHIPVYAMHRHRRLWTDPESFDPSRFEAATVKQRHRYAFLPFGAGPRICIGMGLALTESLVVLASLLPAFQIRPAHSKAPETRFRVTLRPHGGLPVVVTTRRSLT